MVGALPGVGRPPYPLGTDTRIMVFRDVMSVANKNWDDINRYAVESAGLPYVGQSVDVFG